MKRTLVAAALASVLIGSIASASSHREAPLITKYPKVDNTDFYMFHSYEPGRKGYVTILANFQPFQDPFGGPNYYLMDEEALYSIHIDNDGDAREDISFNFRFFNTDSNIVVGDKTKGNIEIPVGDKSVPIPLLYVAPFGASVAQDKSSRNVFESYALVTAQERGGNPNAAKKISLAKNLTIGGNLFPKPSDNVGTKTIPDYKSYANRHIMKVGIDGCASPGRVFVGQRKEPFMAAVGEIFDLMNLSVINIGLFEGNDLRFKNVTTIALEVPISCLTDNSPVIGAWSTASLPTTIDYTGKTKSRGLKQVSRLGMPLVNTLVIGLPDKDKFNLSQPRNDAQFAKYVTHPTLPELFELLSSSWVERYGEPWYFYAPNTFPRTDLVAVFLTGIDGLNRPPNVTPSEMLRLNTSIKPKAGNEQSPLGVLGGDLAGFPNGRRPSDDVVDITFRVAMGALLPLDEAPSGPGFPYTDGAREEWPGQGGFDSRFPYLTTPISGDAEPPPLRVERE